MKAKESFVVYVDDKFVRHSHYSGDTLSEGIRKLEIKKNDEIPAELILNLLTYNREYLDLETATAEELNLETIPPPKITPRKYSQNSLTVLVNSLPSRKADDELRKILKDEFGHSTTITNVGKLTNKILELQERVRRGDKWVE